MRGIPESALIIFFIIVLLIELMAYLGINQLIDHPKTKKRVRYLYWVSSFVLFGILLFAFLNPAKIRDTSNYQFFYFVISVTVFNLIPKILLAVSFFIALVLRLFGARFYAKLLLLSGLILSLGLMLTIGYGITFGRKSIRIIEQEIYFQNLPKGLDQTTIVHISDLHLGSFQDDSFLKKCVKEINAINPDVILFTGDIVNNYYQEMIGFEDELEAMHAKYGKYAILGNHDYGDYSNWADENNKEGNKKTINEKIETAGFTLLLNQSEKLLLKDTAILIIGVENWGHPPFPQYADLDKAILGVDDNLFKILMTHDPAHWEDRVAPMTDISLTLAGHTHGAQSGVLFAGIEFSPMYFIQKYWGGLYQKKDQFLYVNRGLGCVGLLGRIEMKPEITVLKLRSK